MSEQINKSHPPHFNRQTVRTVAERAALRCSNPDCDKLTSGPSPDENKATKIGKAAHIFGARPKSARYRPDMTDIERSNISNAIWVCGDCHDLIDKEEQNFPADLLLMWKNEHEAKITAERGKPADLIRLQFLQQQASKFPDISLYAQEIIKEKATYWQIFLTLETLDEFNRPIFQRWSDLKSGLYTRRLRMTEGKQYFDWTRLKLHDFLSIAGSFSKLVPAIRSTWVPDGRDPSPQEIIHMSKLISSIAARVVEWAEDVRFMAEPHDFAGIQDELLLGPDLLMKNVEEVADFIRDVFAEGDPEPGYHEHTITLALPENWIENIQSRLETGLQGFYVRTQI